jgi:glycosyltransferase involved in cell wall biosynthesis
MTLSFCCWQPVLTAHQAHTFKALSEIGGQLIVVSTKREDPVRQKQGWAANEDEILKAEILPRRGWLGRIRAILDADPNRIHIFGSPFERSRQNVALLLALVARRTVYLLSEPFSSVSAGYLDDSQPVRNALKAKLRPLIYRAYGRLLRSRVAGVFAISQASVDQFVQMGIAREKVHPFGYFVPQEALPSADVGIADRPLRVAYLGSFLARKGVRTLVEAFHRPSIRASSATLDLFGPGEVGTNGLESIHSQGPVPFGQAQRVLSDFDLVVVPSLFDGWAVVVNEAILAGVPVLASKAVGASAMLEKWDCGETFEAGDADVLAAKIVSLSVDRDRLLRYRMATRKLAKVLPPETAAAYMAACIASDLDGVVAPAAPWY